MSTARLIAFGDSWTWGSELRDPSIPGLREDFDHRDSGYRLEHVWSSCLGRAIGRDDVINLAWPGCSNDTILRSLTEWLITQGYLQGQDPSRDLVAIGWTSPERRDFWFHDVDDPSCVDRGWLTMYPMWTHTYKHAAINRFSREYVRYWWHAAEYMHRYINTIHRAQQLLEAAGVEYFMFQAIYHHHQQLITEWNDQQYQVQHELKISDADRQIWQLIDGDRFMHKDQPLATFHNHIIGDRDPREVLLISHPNELGHRLWADHICDWLTQR